MMQIFQAIFGLILALFVSGFIADLLMPGGV